MMGWPDGWVTGPDIFVQGRDPRPGRIGRNAALKILGNGVVPQQAAHAYSALIEEAVCSITQPA
jgi:hypothetical protein